MDTCGHHKSPERLITRDDFRDGTFADAGRPGDPGNPASFEGPAVAKAAAARRAGPPAGVGR
ncbi:MAG: hypothetical protein ACRELW_15895 [Candidatus Rokuibacteriota bacterium]